MALQRRAKTPNEQAQALLRDEKDGILEVHPVLLEWLTRQEWEPGAPRSTGTIMVFVEQGRWKAWLHDRDAQEGCFVTGETLGLLLETVEDILAKGGGDWRPDRKGGRGRG